MFLISHWFVPALLLVLSTVYLVWKLKTGGLFKSIADDPKYKGENALGGIMALFIYLGFSLGLGLVALAVFVLSALWLFMAMFVAIAHGLVVPQALGFGAIVVASAGALTYAWKTGLLTK